MGEHKKFFCHGGGWGWMGVDCGVWRDKTHGVHLIRFGDFVRN